MTIHRVPLTVAAVLLAALVLGGGLPRTAHAEGPAGASLALQSAARADQPNTYVITALLLDAEGVPLEGQRIDFRVAVDFPGDDDSLALGSKSTDATGRAAITYRPTWDGAHTMTARSSRTVEYQSAAAEAWFQVAGAAVPYVEEPHGLGAVRRSLPIVVGLALAAVWMTLAFVVLRTVLGIARARRRSADTATSRYPARMRPAERVPGDS